MNYGLAGCYGNKRLVVSKYFEISVAESSGA